MPTKKTTPSYSPSPYVRREFLTPSEWEAVQLMRTREFSDAEMVHVPKSAYIMAEDVARQLQEMQVQIDRLSKVMDYFTSQLRILPAN